MSPRRRTPAPDPVARAIAVAFLTGDPDPAAMAARAEAAIRPVEVAWLHDLAREIAEVLPGVGSPIVERLTTEIERCDHYAHWVADDGARQLTVTRPPWDVPEPWMSRAEARAAASDELVATARGPRRSSPWPVPPFAHVVDVAEWLGLHPVHLEWYADRRRMERDAPAEPLRHYTYRWVAKASGGARLLEAPKPMLRFFQRRILHEVLDAIPPHPAAHGFRPGRSVLTNAAPHAGRAVLLRMDLESFFASIAARRVTGVFATAGYDPPLARTLAGLVTNTVPLAVRHRAPPTPDRDRATHRRLLGWLGGPHLPQGSPTSPALANLVAFRLDVRLSGLARSFDATYTRYADDLAFAGSHRLARWSPTFTRLVADIAADEGFRVRHAKTRVRPASERQSVAGLVVNHHPQVPRHEYDRLRAVLHDAAVNGPRTANRDGHDDFRAHLLGRIGWVATGNEARAAKLRSLFERIDW